LSDIHRRFFYLYMMEMDGNSLGQDERSELQAHLSTCPSCRSDVRLYQSLRSQASQGIPAVPATITLDKILPGAQPQARLGSVTGLFRAAIWVGIAVLFVLLVEWMFTSLRPAPTVLQPGDPTPTETTLESTPAAIVEEIGKVPLAPLLQGDPYGQGIWSPEGDTFFIPLLELPPAGGDRRSTSLHFISAATGEDCRASETFLGQQGSENYAWLDNERVLFIEKNNRVLLFTACQDGVEDLTDHFSEPLVRVAQPLIPQHPAAQGPLLLEGSSAYWLLDPVSLEARTLADPVPSPNQGDGFAWVGSGRRISVLQPIAGQLESCRLVLLDLDSGEVLRSVDSQVSFEGRAPIIEWMGPERPFIWSFGGGGPLLVDFSQDPPAQVRVLPDLFNLNLEYPNDISSMGVFYSPVNDHFHIVAHINLPDDRSIYLYHSETGQVERLDGDRQMMMILPDDQRMPLVPWQDTPTYADDYDLLWVDRPDLTQTRIQINGHTPRNYPNLQSRLLPGSERMLFGSTQGISLIGLPGGEMLAFWQLSGAEESTLPTLSVAPNGDAVMITANVSNVQDQGSLLYWLALEK
jgi:hypothetical protein